MQTVQTKLLFEIAGIPFELTSNSETILSEIAEYWVKFEGTRPARLKIHLIDFPERELSLSHPRFMKWNAAGFHLSIDGIELLYEAAKESATLWRPKGWGWGDILRQFFWLYLVKQGGMLMHSAALSRNNKVFLFSGPSESGKTTMSRLRGDRDLLSDESVALLPEGNQTFAHSTPFFGELFYVTKNLRLPVTNIFYIFHGKKHLCEPMTEAEALKHLLVNSFHFRWSPEFCDQLLTNLTRMVKTFRSNRLYFLPEESVWDYLKEVGHEL